MDNSSTPDRHKKSNRKNKGGRPTKQKQFQYMEHIRPLWAAGYSTYTAQSMLVEKGIRIGIKTIQAYYREISNKIEDSRDQHWEEQELEQKNRAISAIEKQIRKLQDHQIWMEKCITTEKIRLQLWQNNNTDESGKVTENAKNPPLLRTHVTAMTDLSTSIADLIALAYDIESSPTLTQALEERIGEKISNYQTEIR